MKTITLLLSSALFLTACASSGRRPASFNDRFERRLDKEAELVQRIREGILFLQEAQRKQSGKTLRGTHAKGVCVLGEFTVSDLSHLPAPVASRLKKGIFSQPGQYPAQLRFANAEGKVLPDQEPDVRAVSFSAQIPAANEQGLMDFAMNDATTFPIKDAKTFADLMTIAQHGLVKGGFMIGVRGVLDVKEVMRLGALQKKPATLPFQKMRYFSTVPFALGPSEAVKYSLKPCPKNQAKPLTPDPDTLGEELFRHVDEDQPGCFDFQIQPLEAEAMRDPKGQPRPEQDWVEDASLEWPESQAPFYTVGRVQLKAKSGVAQAECEKWKIDAIANSNEMHRGLGSINRARSEAEWASAEKRNPKP